MNKAEIKYFKSINTIKVNVDSTQLLPKYAKYLFEYLRIPKNAKIVLKDKTYKNIQEWINEYES